jgi:mannose-6-phosphate isomerase-like protein (cupin superfamily)
MHVVSIATQKPFTTRDGSTIRSILDRTNAPVRQQSLAEASLEAGRLTERHYHRASEEFYFILEGSGEMRLGEETREVGPGDAILIPPNTWHSIKARTALRFLCCCAPPYSHEDTFLE